MIHLRKRRALPVIGAAITALIAGAVLVGTASSASADTLSVSASADTYTRYDVPDTNYSTAVRFSVQGDANYWRHSLIRFPVVVPSGQEVTAAKFRVTVDGGATGTGGVDLYKTADTWTPSSVTWHTEPAPGTWLGKKTVTAAGTVLEWDVKSALNNTTGTGQLDLKMETGDAGWYGFKSSETSTPPQLVLTTQAVVTPPPPLKPMLVGANSIAYDDLDATIKNTDGSKPGGVNAGLSIRRSYDGSWRTFSSTTAAGDPARKAASFISFSNPTVATLNSGTSDAAITTFFNSIPAGHTTLVSWIHEVDNNKTTDYAGYRAGVARIHNLLVASNADQNFVKFGVILTGGGYQDGTYPDFYPTDTSKFDFIGVDPYEFLRPPGSPDDPKCHSLCNLRTPSYLLGSAPAFSASTGKPLAIGEYGAHPFPDDTDSRPRRMKAWAEYLDGIPAGTLAFCYFHAGVGESGAWWLDRFHNFTTDQYSPDRALGDPDPDSLSAWRDIVSTHVKTTG